MSVLKILGLVLLIVGAVVLVLGVINLVDDGNSFFGKTAKAFGTRTNKATNSIIQIVIGAGVAFGGFVLFKRG
jgi:hypothetical protein